MGGSFPPPPVIREGVPANRSGVFDIQYVDLPTQGSERADGDVLILKPFSLWNMDLVAHPAFWRRSLSVYVGVGLGKELSIHNSSPVKYETIVSWRVYLTCIYNHARTRRPRPS